MALPSNPPAQSRAPARASTTAAQTPRHNPSSKRQRQYNTRSESLKTYTWTGRNASGSVTDGTIDAASLRLARLHLRQRGIRPTRIKRLHRRSLSFARTRRSDIVTFTRQLGTMLKSGIPMVQALDAVEQGSEKKVIASLLSRIRARVETGDTFSSALRSHPKQFDSLYTGLVTVGEESGTLDSMLINIASHLEKIESLKRKVFSAMTYPMIVLIVGFLILLFLMLKIVPQFAQIFASFNATLPWLTQVLLDISNSLQEHFLFWALVVAGISALLIMLYRHHRATHYLVDRLILRLPVFGPLLRKSVLSRVSRTIAIMFRAGVPMVEALDTISLAAGNDVYRRALEYTRDEVTTGRALEPSMRETGRFPNLVLQMIRTGEATGEIDSMMERAADYFDDEIDTTVATISSLIEPILVIFLGVIIGIIVIAMYLPIFNLASIF